MEMSMEMEDGMMSEECTDGSCCSVPPTGAVVPMAAAEVKVNHRKGPRKVVAADGSVSYGFKLDGTPKKRPGRPAKSKVE